MCYEELHIDVVVSCLTEALLKNHPIFWPSSYAVVVFLTLIRSCCLLRCGFHREPTPRNDGPAVDLGQRQRQWQCRHHHQRQRRGRRRRQRHVQRLPLLFWWLVASIVVQLEVMSSLFIRQVTPPRAVNNVAIMVARWRKVVHFCSLGPHLEKPIKMITYDDQTSHAVSTTPVLRVCTCHVIKK